MLEGKALLATLNCVLFFDCFAVLLYTIPQTFSEPWSAHGTSFCFVAIADLARSMQLNKGVKGAVAFFWREATIIIDSGSHCTSK